MSRPPVHYRQPRAQARAPQAVHAVERAYARGFLHGAVMVLILEIAVAGVMVGLWMAGL